MTYARGHRGRRARQGAGAHLLMARQGPPHRASLLHVRQGKAGSKRECDVVCSLSCQQNLSAM